MRHATAYSDTIYMYRWSMSQSICRHFVAIHSWNVCRSRKSQKITTTPYFWSSKLFKVIDVDVP